MLAVILLSFTIYGIYQPKILKDLGFIELAASLKILQGFLGVVIEPLFGGWSDRILARFGSRLPLITAGVTLAGLIFVIIAFLAHNQLPRALHGIFPVLMTVWVIAMIAVRGPVVALLIQFAPLTELPIANAVVVLILGLTAAVGPLLSSLVQQIGASITFMIGAIALLIGGTILYSTAPQRAYPSLGTISSSSIPLPKSRHRSIWILLFAVGLGAAFEANVLLGIFPAVLQQSLPQLHPVGITSSILLIAALSANPLSGLVIKWGEPKAMQIGLTAVLGVMGLTVFSSNNAILAVIWLVALGIAFGLVFTDTIPYALSMLPPQQAGLATGLYFGGGSAATALFALLQQQAGGLSATQGLGGAVISCTFANFCLLRSAQVRRKTATNSEESSRSPFSL